MKSKFFCSLVALTLIFGACNKDLINQAEDENSANAVRLKSSDGVYTVIYTNDIDNAIINGKVTGIMRFKLIDDEENTEFAYCADLNTFCYNGAKYKVVSTDGYFKNNEDTKIMAALTYMMNEYGWMETDNPNGYRLITQCIIWKIINNCEITTIYNSDGKIIKEALDHINDNIGEITEDYITSVTMQGENTAVEDGDFVNYGPYQVSENVFLSDVVFDLTFDKGGDNATFVDETGEEITQVKPGESFFVRVTAEVFGEFAFTATASATEKLWYVDDFRFFIDVRDENFPEKHEYQPLLQPLTNSDARTYFYSCSSSFTITSTEPEPEPKPEPEFITLTALNWNNGDGNGNGGGINQFTVNGITLKNNKNYVTPAIFDVKVAKTPGKNDETAIYTVTERTVTKNGKYTKVYDIKVALYGDGIWKGYGGTITVDNPGGNNNNQQVDLERIF